MPSNSTTNGFGRGLTPAESFPGDHIGKVTPVPIPNTEVKLFEPMIVLTCAKVGPSDPVIPYGRVIAHQLKGTLGITGLSPPSVHSGVAVWHLDVGSSHPGGEEAPKGLAVRQ